VVAQEHYFIIAHPDGFKKRIAIAEGPVIEGYGGLINADQVPVENAIFIPGLLQCYKNGKNLFLKYSGSIYLITIKS
jgi:hypothetical protein